MTPAPTVPLSEVEWRVDGKPTTKDGQTTCRFVPYLDALWVSQALDEWTGAPWNWQDDYEVVRIDGKDAMFCRLSILHEGEWVTHTDIGVASNFEGQKGSVTDAFKRCASRKWGVGRNVYDLPTLWAPCRTYQANGKEQAAPNRDSLPAIMRELKARGFGDVEGGKVRDVDTETGEITEAAPGPLPFDLDRFKATCAASEVDPLDVVAFAELDKELDDLTEADRPALKAALSAMATTPSSPGEAA